ncbi:MAG TPA: hypothetical protein VKF62_13325, partial [Planctomycetota bacterium]|nr:hypothetical protein [Planctomycetota bacterium]
MPQDRVREGVGVRGGAGVSARSPFGPERLERGSGEGQPSERDPEAISAAEASPATNPKPDFSRK